MKKQAKTCFGLHVLQTNQVPVYYKKR